VEEAHTSYVGRGDRSRLELEGTADLSLAREEENFNQLLRDIRELPEEMFNFLSKLSDVSVPTRYPEDFAKLVETYDKKMAETYLTKTKEVFQWIRNCIGS